MKHMFYASVCVCDASNILSIVFIVSIQRSRVFVVNHIDRAKEEEEKTPAFYSKADKIVYTIVFCLFS